MYVGKVGTIFHHKAPVWVLLLLTILTALLILSPEISETEVNGYPIPSHPAGYYPNGFTLSFSPPHRSAQVLLTSDGRSPTSTDRYTGAIILSAPQVSTIRTRLLWPDGTLGPITTYSYFTGSAPLPRLSITVDPADLWNADSGIYQNPLQRGRDWERPAMIAFDDCSQQPLSLELAACTPATSAAGIRIHGGNSRNFDKKSLRVYFRQAYSQNPFEAAVFTATPEPFEQIVIHSGAQDTGQFSLSWTLLRNQLISELTHDIGGYATRSRPALLYINGELWGIYQLRDRPNDAYLHTHYQFESPVIIDSPGLADPTGPASDDLANWNQLITEAGQLDLTLDENYQRIVNQIDLASFIDYHLLQIYAANTDWPGHNYRVFRPQVAGGRWYWMSWDSDYAMGLEPILTSYPTSLSTENTLQRILQLPVDQEGYPHVVLLQALMQNDTFRQRFVDRGHHLLDNQLSTEAVTQHIDQLSNQLEPAIPYETGRWPTRSNWHANVNNLRQFAAARPDIMRQHLAQLEQTK